MLMDWSRSKPAIAAVATVADAKVDPCPGVRTRVAIAGLRVFLFSKKVIKYLYSAQVPGTDAGVRR